ncbi:cutinase family protein (plasmid) [Nocardia sp. CA-084685]|uniref:cutinase family protein n=1 Tax=Nocardia sp. CA-084685 TaxID=3239970 RepID=UPI003D970B80
MRPTVTHISTAATTVLLACAVLTGTAHADDTSDSCTPLHLLLANGTTESAPNAATDQDSGFSMQIAVPAMLQANRDGRTLLSRSYLPYSASFGGKPGDRASDPYSLSVNSGVANGVRMLNDQAQQCPKQKMFLVGYSQGAQVMATIAADIANGRGPIPADRVAGVALFSNPLRIPGAPVFATAGQNSPAKVPGAAGSSVTQVHVGTVTPPDGGGIAPTKTAPSFAGMAGRVASWCAHGDLACDTPKDAALARVVANIASQSKLDPTDPIGILTSVGTAVGQSILYTGSKFITDNVGFNSATGRVEIKASAGPTVMDRLVEASNPNLPKDGIGEAIKAITKLAGMAISATISVVKTVLSPASIGEIAAAGVAGPEAALAMLGTKVAGAALKLVSPVTAVNAVQLAFHELEQGAIDNAGLVRIAMDSTYWNTAQQHTSYVSTPVGVDGQTAAQLTADWVAAAAADLADTPAASTTATKPRTGPLLASPDRPVLPASQILAGHS